MTGLILCNRCRKKMDGVCKCGNYKCLVQVYWKGRYYEFRRDGEGYVFTYDKAIHTLVEINGRIKKRTFDPADFQPGKIVERKFENQIEKWLEEKAEREARNELSPGTVNGCYRGYVKNYYLPYFTGKDVRTIGREDLYEFFDSTKRVSIKTRKNIRNALYNFFVWMKERGIRTEIPPFPKITGDDSQQRKAIDIDTQDAGLAGIVEGDRDVIEFMMETGRRPGEVAALLCEDMHLTTTRPTYDVNKTYVRGNKIRETTKPKRKFTFPLSHRAAEIARKHMAGKMPKQFLFINPNTGRGYLPNRLWGLWRKYSGMGGEICLYEATRHSFGSQMIQKNDVSVVKELMGQSDIRSTEKYLHFKVAHLAEALDGRRQVVELVPKGKKEVKEK
jgi:integrase